MPTPAALVALLNDSSSRYRDPLSRLAWDSLDLGSWWLPPPALSLAGVTQFERLPPSVQRRLSHYEFVWLLEAGLWLEALFVEHLSRNLDATADLALRSRHLHEIREEAGHSLMFIELMQRSGIRIPDAARFRPRLGRWLARFLGKHSALFWSLVVIGEELPDKLNRMVRGGVADATVSSLVYHMATLHIIDEARHIAHARAMCAAATHALPAWRRNVLSPLLQGALVSYARYVFYPPALVYELAGLPAHTDWHALAAHNTARRQLAAHAIKSPRDFLCAQGWRLKAVCD